MRSKEEAENVYQGTPIFFLVDSRAGFKAITLDNMCISNTFMNSPTRFLPTDCGFDDRIQVWDSPVAMAGEISVVPASPGSREVKKNEIGVEFKATLSDREVYEAIYMRKIDNGTVVLEVWPLTPTNL